MVKQKIMRIAWPSFLSACALEMLVFSWVDPTDLSAMNGPWVTERPMAYTLAFFAFWCVTAASCALTSMLSETTEST